MASNSSGVINRPADSGPNMKNPPIVEPISSRMGPVHATAAPAHRCFRGGGSSIQSPREFPVSCCSFRMKEANVAATEQREPDWALTHPFLASYLVLGKHSMPSSRYVVGIDLGTTNSALAYADTGVPEGQDIVLAHLPVPQVVQPGTVEERPLMPSF